MEWIAIIGAFVFGFFFPTQIIEACSKQEQPIGNKIVGAVSCAMMMAGVLL